MKRAKLGKAKATQSKAKAKTVEQYLAQTQEPARSTLNRVRETIRSAVPTDIEEVMSYGIPAFKWKKMVVWYAAFADHCSLFPTASVIAKFKEELTDYRVSKGTIHFAVDKPLPANLVRKMVKARLADIEGKKQR
jgi:uncharacterized protein YdhG (YjbR/CyaY superfamily)